MATIYVDDVVASEADGFVSVVLRLDAAASQVITVQYATSNGTATYVSASDYTATSNTATFGIGETTVTVQIPIGAGTAAEALESFYFLLSNPVNASLGNTSALIGIVDNDTVVETPTLSVRDVVVDEKAGTATFYVVLGGPNGQASNSTVTVDYATGDTATNANHATAGVDYAGAAGTLSFAPGETVKAITIDIVDDAVAEGFERFGLNLSGAVGATITGGHAEARIGASDGTAVAQPRISVSDAFVSEADGFVDFVVSLSAPGQGVVTVNYATSNGTATYVSASDYLARSGTLTFAQGETTKVVRVQLGNDPATSENLESFYLSVSGASANATIAKAWGQALIVDNDRVVEDATLSVRDVIVDEKDGTATFVVLLGGPHGHASNGTITVDYATGVSVVGANAATAGSDYAGVSGTLTFAPGETVKTITVDLFDDASAESFERFGLNLSNATGATILDGHAEARIGASDGTAVAQPRLSVSDAFVSESDGYVDFVVSLSAPGQAAVTVNYATSNGTATYVSASDYLAQSGTLTFAAGETTQVVRVLIGDDTTAENLESLYLSLSGPSTNATLAKAFGQAFIVDDDRVVDEATLVVRDVVVDEKSGTATFVVTLGGPHGHASNGAITVDYATGASVVGANGATAGSDYGATSGTLVFAPGETVKSISVDIVDDALAERFERFGMNLSNAVGATILDGHAEALIGAGDGTSVAQPRLAVSDVVVSERDGYADFVVSLSAPAQSEVTVNFATSNATATYVSASDYLAQSGKLTFAAGETTKVVRVLLGDDSTVENLENLYLSLSGPSANATLAKAFGQAFIVDNDDVVDTAGLFVRDAIVDEKAGTATFVVMLGGPTGQSSNSVVTVDYATGAALNASATAGSDYTPVSGKLTFAPGESVQTITVDITDDAGAEVLERLALNLSNVTGAATIVDGRAVAEVGASDTTAVAQPHLTIDDVRASEADGYVDVLVRLTAPGQGVVSVNYATANGTATYVSASDYVAQSGKLTFAAGETTKTVRIALGDGTTAEALETFSVTLSSPIGAVVDRATAVVTVVDNDSPGIDVFSHGRSDDVYTVDQTSDLIVENLGGGIDQVYSTATYTLGANVDHLTLQGAAAISGTGNALANRIIGNSAANLLQGLAGNDTLDGSGGNDTMNGGTGNDLFRVGSVGDKVVEGAGAGTDKVESTVTYTLSVNVENLTLLGTSAINGTGNASANLIVGNSAANRLTGLDGNDTLDGGAGNDTLVGGLGNDTYVVNATGDVVTELAAAGSDTLQINRTAALTGAFANIEKLVLTGTAAINGTGNAAVNTITGNGATNVLAGGAGADTLRGGAGNDFFVLDSKNGIDLLADYSSVADTVRIKQSAIRVGDGDALVEGAVSRSAAGGFSTSAELVIFSANISGGFTNATAAAKIGTATGTYAIGATRLFVVDNGTQSAVYLFTSQGQDGAVSATELTQLAVISAPSTNLADFVFIA